MSLESTVWIVGDWKHADFGEAIASLRTRAQCLLFDHASPALLSLRGIEVANVPTAIMLAQSRPGQIGRADVERLYAAAPLARLVALVGAWCEGELRSGQPWPGLVRVPLSAWRYRLQPAIGLNEANAHGPMPRTATAVERIESTLTGLCRPRDHRLRTVVLSSRRANYEAIADMLRQVGVESVWQSEAGASVAAVDVVIFDGWEQISSDGTRVLDRQDGIAPARVLLLHFPREDDYARAAGEGIAEVVAQPLLLSDLATALGKATSKAAGPLACASGWY